MMLITRSHPGVFTVLGLISLGVAACGTNPQEPEADLSTATPAAAEQPAPVPDMIEMGGAKSVTTFFITSVGPGNGGDLGGLDGPDQSGGVDAVELDPVFRQTPAQKSRLFKAVIRKGRIEIGTGRNAGCRVGLRLPVSDEVELTLEIVVYQG